MSLSHLGMQELDLPSAYSHICEFILAAEGHGVEKCHQMLLHVKCGAGEGRSTFLNGLSLFTKNRVELTHRHDNSFLAIVTLTASANALQRLLRLPTEPLMSHAQLRMLKHETDKIGLIILNEAMDVWEIDAMLKAARPQANDQPFGGISVVLLGDFQVS